MAIATTAEIKALLQITDTDYDTVIDALIPVLTDVIISYTNNYFHTSKYISASTIAFVDSDPDTITDSDSGFVTAEFTDDIDIHVEDSEDNDGFYHVDTTVAGTLTLASNESVIVEAVGAGITITRMSFPIGLRLPLAMLVQLSIDQKMFKGISSESLSEHSISYVSGKGGGGDFPDSIKNMLNKWRKVKWQ